MFYSATMHPWEKTNYGSIAYHRVTREEIERNQQKQRENDYKLQSFDLYNKGDSNIRVANQMEKNADYKRKRNNIAIMNAENMLDESYRNNRIASVQGERFNEQEKLLAEELAKEKLRDLMKQREIQRICEEDEDLVDLQEKLKVIRK